jgi:hypothetical protein
LNINKYCLEYLLEKNKEEIDEMRVKLINGGWEYDV